MRVPAVRTDPKPIDPRWAYSIALMKRLVVAIPISIAFMTGYFVHADGLPFPEAFQSGLTYFLLAYGIVACFSSIYVSRDRAVAIGLRSSYGWIPSLFLIHAISNLEIAWKHGLSAGASLLLAPLVCAISFVVLLSGRQQAAGTRNETWRKWGIWILLAEAFSSALSSETRPLSLMLLLSSEQPWIAIALPVALAACIGIWPPTGRRLMPPPAESQPPLPDSQR